MTTLLQLPQAQVVRPSDQLLLEQNGATVTATVANVLTTVQPRLTLASGALLGRASLTTGGPEPIAVGRGLVAQSGTLAADATVLAPLASPAFTGTPSAPTPAPNDNSNALATTAFVQAHATPLTAATVGAALSDAIPGYDVSAATTKVSGGVARTLASQALDQPNAKTLGAAGNGVSDDTAPIRALDAAGGGFLPAGTYRTTIDFATAAGPFTGPGRLVDGAGHKRGPVFANVTAKPSGTPSEGSVVTAFDGDFSKVSLAFEHRIADGNGPTVGQPAPNSYLYNPQTAAIYGYVFNTSGANGTTSDDTSRTGTVAARIKVDQYGQGDLVAYNATGFVASTRPGATHFLANPAVSLFNGDVEAGAAGTYLNPIEVALADQGLDVAGVGAVVNLGRTNATGALGTTWIGYRAQSTGTQPVDALFSGTGPARIGLDLAGATLAPTTKAALAVRANARLYLNATNADTHLFPSSVALGTEWLEYDPANGMQFVVGASSVARFTPAGGSLAASPAGTDASTAIATTASVAARTPGVHPAAAYPGWNAATDVGPAIQAAIDAASAAGGGRVVLPVGIFPLATPLILGTSLVSLVSAGGLLGTAQHDETNTPSFPTVLTWSGAAAATMLTVAPAAGHGGTFSALAGIDLAGILFDCAVNTPCGIAPTSGAATGVAVKSLHASQIHVGVRNAGVAAIVFDTVPLDEYDDVFGNDVSAIVHNGSSDGDGIVLQATTAGTGAGVGYNGNVAINAFRRLYLRTRLGWALKSLAADNNTFDICDTSQVVPAWQSGAAVTQGQVVRQSSGAFYRATIAGTSAATGTGPTGNAAAIADGTVTWTYLGISGAGLTAGTGGGVYLGAKAQQHDFAYFQGASMTADGATSVGHKVRLLDTSNGTPAPVSINGAPAVEYADSNGRTFNVRFATPLIASDNVADDIAFLASGSLQASSTFTVVNASQNHLVLSDPTGTTVSRLNNDGANLRLLPPTGGKIFAGGTITAANAVVAIDPITTPSLSTQTLAVTGTLTGATITAATVGAADNSTNVATTAWVNANAYVQQVATLAALRALPAIGLTDGAARMVNAYATRGDGGAGLFVWNSTSTAADNSGTVVDPTSNTGAGRWLRQLPDGRVTPQMFGAKGDGATDDTAAFAAALATGPTIVPNARYVVANLAVPNGAWMEGGAGLGYAGDIGAGTPGAAQKSAVVAPILLAKPGTTSCILNVNGCGDATLKGLFLDGQTTSCDGISSGSTQLMLERVTVVRCVNGLGATSTAGYTGLADLYTHVATLINCEFANCTNGIANLIDSNMVAGAVSANVTGINLGSGANGNTFVGCRYEWNSQDGVQGYSCASNVFCGGLFDRNSWRGVNLGTGCSDFTFVGVQFNRNGAVNAYPNNAHVALNGTTSVFFNGCVSRTGKNDDGTGNLTPAYFVSYINTNALVTISGCDVSGYVTAFSFGTNPTSYVQRDNDGAGDTLVNAARPFISGGVACQTPWAKASANVAPGASATIAMGASPFTNNYAVVSRELLVTATNNNAPYQTVAARFNLAFYRDTAVHAPGASAAFGEAGGTGIVTWGGSGKLQLSASNVASDGSTWTLGVLNGGTGDGSNWSVFAELH